MAKTSQNHPEFTDFYLPFGGRLNSENRWLKLAEVTPWDVIEECYRESLTEGKIGAPSYSSRVAYGALIIQEQKGLTDVEVVNEIFESPYLQAFLGYKELLKSSPFDSSLMVHFRKRFTQEHHDKINRVVIKEGTPSNSENSDQQDPPSHGGKLMIDATCTPADISYPTDLKLLNGAREHSEKLIDWLHQHTPAVGKKPRTYRRVARKDYLNVAKQKKAGAKKIRKGLKKQLDYLKRNLKSLSGLIAKGDGVKLFTNAQLKTYYVIQHLYEQQQEMYRNKVNRCSDRIVSITQPHVRPIVRGKTGVSVEFGAKISISHQANGFVTIERLSWDNYNECNDLEEQVENYKKQFGVLPESIHADQIYHTRENRSYCKRHGIRLSAKPLGRPKKETEQNKAELKAEKDLRQQDYRDRNAVEGAFGVLKRKGSLSQIMAKLPRTSESVIHVAVLVMNLRKRLKEALRTSFWRTQKSALESYFITLFEELLKGLQRVNFHIFTLNKGVSLFQ